MERARKVGSCHCHGTGVRGWDGPLCATLGYSRLLQILVINLKHAAVSPRANMVKDKDKDKEMDKGGSHPVQQ